MPGLDQVDFIDFKLGSFDRNWISTGITILSYSVQVDNWMLKTVGQEPCGCAQNSFLLVFKNGFIRMPWILKRKLTDTGFTLVAL